MDCRMDGRTAIVTGGSMGLGLAIAEEYARSGANVGMVARRADVLDEAKSNISKNASGKVDGFVCDMSDAAAIGPMFDAVTKSLGAVDVIVNNAGSSQRKPFLEITDEMWQSDLELKLFGAIRLTRLAFPGMIERRWGRIINVLNVGAKAPPAGGAPTAVSRAAGMALTKVLAGEGAPHNVLVNALLVGRIVSDQIARRHADADTNVSLEDYIAEAGEAIPMGRMGTAAEFANIATFLASNAGSYITGTAINVDGNLSPMV